MFQMQLNCASKSSLDADLNSLEKRLEDTPHATLLFHVFDASPDSHASDEVCAALAQRFPQAPYVCTSSNALLSDGVLNRTEQVSVCCNTFEDPDTKLEIHQFALDYESQDETTQSLIDLVKANPWVKAIEMITTINDANMPRFCRQLEELPDRIVCFGGAAVNPATSLTKSMVSSSAGTRTHHGIVFILYGGENFHASTMAIHGWRPLGMPFRITRAERSIIYELNDKPAYEVYNHYLNIPEDDDFSWNGLLFPIAIDYDGISILRTPLAVNPDGSLLVTADISKRAHKCRIAYGDPGTILHRVEQTATNLQEFQPQGILCFSCASRLLYWGDDYIDRETLPFQAVAPTAGFFTGGEFIRHDGHLIQHNVTLVLAALREGDRDESLKAPTPIAIENSEFNRQLAIINRMASFIGAASDELHEAYMSMEIMARTDGLTGLADRRETERLIVSALKNEPLPKIVEPVEASGNAGTPALIMLDLDNFKQINDQYGHDVGDDVLRALAQLLHRYQANHHVDLFAGRWGGEEFMILLPYVSLDDAVEIGDLLREEFANLNIPEVGHRTMSVGVAKAVPGEPVSALCSRADAALYRAKAAGKNRVEVADPPTA